ncbi:hypothetical protein ACFYUV_25255 [Nonomuraea sp. NPDC003560]|uniref:hypothetical protein n=1 Tax=Nonomuraea sp. NPDC003560 TaxID=3364341 RepID=UPI0036890290
MNRATASLSLTPTGLAARRLPPLVSVLILDVILLALVLALTRVHRQVAETLNPDDGA